MTKKQAKYKLNGMMPGGDTEAMHVQAEAILMEFLRTQGYEDLAIEYELARDRVDFHY